MALQETVVARIGTEMESLVLVLGFNVQDINTVTIKWHGQQTYLKGMATDFLRMWKTRNGSKATLAALHYNLQSIRMMSLAGAKYFSLTH